jgi:hypothetical protein
MSDRGDELRTLRGRVADLEALLGRSAGGGPAPTPRMVGQVFNAGAMPTSCGKYFATHPVEVTGPQSENALATFAADATRTALVRVLCSSPPAAGAYLLAHQVPYRWEAEVWGRSCASVCVTALTFSACKAAGVTITLLNASNAVVGTCVIDASGTCCIPAPSAGTYHVTTDGCFFASSPFSVACGHPAGAVLTGNAPLNLVVNYCCGGSVTSFAQTLVPPSGTTVTVTDTTNGNSCLVVVGQGFTNGTNLVDKVARNVTYRLDYHDGQGCYQDSTVNVTVASCTGTGTLPMTPKTFSYAIQVVGCLNVGLPGATAVATSSGGGVGASGVTDASGWVTFTLSADCLYTITASKARFATATTGTGAIHTPCHDMPVSSPPFVQLPMTPATGYVCFGCNDPWPTTLHLTDPNGTIALTWVGAAYYGCYQAPTDPAISCVDAFGVCHPASGQVAVGYQLTVHTTGGTPDAWQLEELWTACGTGLPTDPAATGGCSSGAATVPQGVFCGGGAISGGGEFLNSSTTCCGGQMPDACIPVDLPFTVAGYVTGAVTVLE